MSRNLTKTWTTSTLRWQDASWSPRPNCRPDERDFAYQTKTSKQNLHRQAHQHHQRRRSGEKSRQELAANTAVSLQRHNTMVTCLRTSEWCLRSGQNLRLRATNRANAQHQRTVVPNGNLFLSAWAYWSRRPLSHSNSTPVLGPLKQYHTPIWYYIFTHIAIKVNKS